MLKSYGQTSIIRRFKKLYHVYPGDNWLRGLLSSYSLKPDDAAIPPRAHALPALIKDTGFYPPQANSLALSVGNGKCSHGLWMDPDKGIISCLLDIEIDGYGSMKILFGNDVIDAPVENRLDSKLPPGLPQSLGKVSDFPTITWIIAKPIIHIPKSSVTANFIKLANMGIKTVDLKLPL